MMPSEKPRGRKSTVVALFFCFWCISTAVALSASLGPVRNAAKPIEKVAIIGGGIAGLSLAHALTNSVQENASSNPVEVSIFDAREKFERNAGGGVQLNGGISVLGKINPDVRDAVIKAGLPLKKIQGGNKSWFGDSIDKLWDFSIEEIIRNAGENVQEELIVNDKVMWYSIMRGALQDTLINTLPNGGTKNVCFDKCLTSIKGNDDGAFCEFADGTTAGPFDLVVGCDGVKSAVKEYVCTGDISRDGSKREGNSVALYSGIRIAFAVQDIADITEESKSESFQQIFGDGQYALVGLYGNGDGKPLSKCVFITALDEDYNGPFKRKDSKMATAAAENSDWAQNNLEETKQKMKKLFEESGVSDDRILSTIQNSDRIFELGVYFHNPFTLAGWKKKITGSNDAFAVLIGDAAHTMPPFLGQGANQAIQDAYSLAEKIHRYNNCITNSQEERDSEFKPLLQEYEKTRWIPTTIITAKAALLGYLETGGRDGFYAKFRDVFFKTLALLGVPAKVLIDAATPKV